MAINEVYYYRNSFKTKFILIQLAIIFISSLNLIFSKNSVKNSRSKSKNKLLSRLNKSHNERSTVKAKTKLTEENIKEIIQAHNDLRNKVAMGQTSKGSSLPQAANMLQVYWSPTIAKGAQEWADRCAMGHSPKGKYTFNGKGLGENIAYRSFTGKKKKSPFTLFVNNWFNEIEDYNGNVGNFESTGGPAIGHFTQVAWAESYLIGCGYCKKKEGKWTKEYMVCQYYNQGNFIGQPIYQVKNGNECKCAEGYACKNPDYPGLCCPNTLNRCQKDTFMWTE